MAAVEDRLTKLETTVAALESQVKDTHTLAAAVDRDVAGFRQELRVQTDLINLTRLDMGTLREDMGTLREDMGTLREDMGTLREDMGTLREDMGTLREDMDNLREETRAGFAKVNTGMAQIVRLIEG